MKSYVSIPSIADSQKVAIYSFYKYDGSLIRTQWDRKQGFNLFGTKNNLFDKNNQYFGIAVALFQDLLAGTLEQIIRKDKYLKMMKKIVFFSELCGINSFAGWHDQNDKTKTLVLFDVFYEKQGLISPQQFLNIFGHIKNTQELVYTGNYNKIFEDSIINNTINLTSQLCNQPIPEGVVCKTAEKGKYLNSVMWKVKTKKWKEECKKRHPIDWEELI